MTSGFRSILCFCVLEGSLLVIVIMTEAAKDAIVKLTFKLQSLPVIEIARLQIILSLVVTQMFLDVFLLDTLAFLNGSKRTSAFLEQLLTCQTLFGSSHYVVFFSPISMN